MIDFNAMISRQSERWLTRTRWFAQQLSFLQMEKSQYVFRISRGYEFRCVQKISFRNEVITVSLIHRRFTECPVNFKPRLESQ